MIDVNKRLEETFGSLGEPTSISSFDNNIAISNSNDNSSDFSVHNGVVSGNYEVQDMKVEYELGPKKGSSHITYSENGKTVFDGSLEEFKKFHAVRSRKFDSIMNSFSKGFKNGREKAKENKFEIRDNYDVDELPKKKRRGCGTGCIIFLIIALLITIIFGSSIYHWILTMINTVH